MRNFWAIILCISVAGPFAAGYLFVHLVQTIHQHQTRLRITSDRLDGELTTLYFSASEFASLEWEHDHEFEWMGMRYDVKSIRSTSGGVEILCWKDDKDSRLTGLKDRITERKNGDSPLRSEGESPGPSFKIQLDLPGDGIPFLLGAFAFPAVPSFLETPQEPGPHEPPTPPPDHAA